MHVHHSGVEELLVDGQPLYVPSSAAWQALWSEPVFEGKRLPVPDLLARKVASNQHYPEIVSALGFAYDRVWLYELLRFQGQLYRVFIEAVICDHCGHRAVQSATPGIMEIYWGSENPEAARERSYSLPRLSCFRCHKVLERRRTVWQVNAPEA